MPQSFGYRAGTRSLFSRDFRKHGMPNITTYLTTFHVGDLVDVKGNGAIQKGMPHKFYHGKTGVVFNVTKRAIGVEMNKYVNGRIIKKRIHVRFEHVKHSKCRLDFLNRVRENEKLKKEAKARGETVQAKRMPQAPAAGGLVKQQPQPEILEAIPYEILC